MKRFALLGNPVAHSKSKQLFDAAFPKAVSQGSYELLCLEESMLEKAVAGLRRGEYSGYNVTAPYKEKVLAFVDERTQNANDAIACNTLYVRGNKIVAENTDVVAMTGVIDEMLGKIEPLALILGDGGAAKASIVACYRKGAKKVFVRARRFAEEEYKHSFCRLFQSFGEINCESMASYGTAESEVNLVVQATSSGMKGKDSGEKISRCVDWVKIGSKTVAIEQIYEPSETPFLAEARKHGLVSKNGLSLLFLQALEAYKCFGLENPNQRAMQAVFERIL